MSNFENVGLHVVQLPLNTLFQKSDFQVSRFNERHATWGLISKGVAIRHLGLPLRWTNAIFHRAAQNRFCMLILGQKNMYHLQVSFKIWIVIL